MFNNRNIKADSLAFLNGINLTATQNALESSVSMNLQSQKVLNNMNTSTEQLEHIQSRIDDLVKLYELVEEKQKELNTRQEDYITNNLYNATNNEQALTEWINNNDWTKLNENKIIKINVFYTLEYITKISYDVKKNNQIESKSIGTAQSGNQIRTIEFKDDEFLTRIIVSTGNAAGLAKQIKIYSSYNSSNPIKVPNIEINNNDKIKLFYYKPEKLTWEQHNQKAKSSGLNLACITNFDENTEVRETAGNNHIWIGLYHKNKPQNKGSLKSWPNSKSDPEWTWVDGTPFKYELFGGREPNNWGGHEPVINMWRNGYWNDHNLNVKFPAVYQKILPITSNEARSSHLKQINKITSLIPLQVDYDNRYISDTSGKDAVENISKAAGNTREILLEALSLLDEINGDLDLTKRDILIIIENLTKEYNDIVTLHNIGDEALDEYENYQKQFGNSSDLETFKNINDQNNNNNNNNILDKIYNFFFNNKMINNNIENMENNDPFTRANDLVMGESINRQIDMMDSIDSEREKEVKKYLGELLVKRNNLFTNTVMDYMISNDKGSDINKVYEDVEQNNNKKIRQIGINNYFTDAYKEYIDLIKIIILMCVILIPVLVLNSNYLLPKNITMLIVVCIVTGTVIYTIYKLIDMNMRDNKEYDKIKIPYDRTAEKLAEKGKLDIKTNPLIGNLTCIGDECCDPSMTYDNLKNRCVIIENFGGYFDNINQQNSNCGSDTTSVVVPTEGFANNCDIKQQTLITSLNYSDKYDFLIPYGVSSVRLQE